MKAILVCLIGAAVGFVLADMTRLSPAERSARWVSRVLNETEPTAHELDRFVHTGTWTRMH